MVGMRMLLFAVSAGAAGAVGAAVYTLFLLMGLSALAGAEITTDGRVLLVLASALMAPFGALLGVLGAMEIGDAHDREK